MQTISELLERLGAVSPAYKASDFDRLVAALRKPIPRRIDYTSGRAFRRALRKFMS